MTSSPPPSSHGAGPRRSSPPPPDAPWSEAPTFTFFATFLGAVLILLQGLVVLSGGAGAFSFVAAPSGSDAGQLGGAAVAVGIGIVAAAFALQENHRHRRGIGVVIVILGALSIVGGGGFLIGLPLTLLGGLAAILLRPTSVYRLTPPAGR